MGDIFIKFIQSIIIICFFIGILVFYLIYRQYRLIQISEAPYIKGTKIVVEANYYKKTLLIDLDTKQYVDYNGDYIPAKYGAVVIPNSSIKITMCPLYQDSTFSASSKLFICLDISTLVQNHITIYKKPSDRDNISPYLRHLKGYIKDL